MTDEDDIIGSSPGGDTELLLYDHFKHLTTLGLLSLGGVLTLAEIAKGSDVSPGMLAVVIVTLALGSVLAFQGGSEIVRARYTGTVRKRSLAFSRVGAPAFLAIGVGMFLSMFIDSLA